MSQDGSRLQNDSDEDVPLGSPEVLAANLLEAFAAADATSQGAAPAEWTIASFGGGADFAMSEDQAGVHAASPAQHAGTQVRLSELECDGDDDGSEAGSELSLLQPTPPRGHSADTMPPSEAVHTTPGAGSADSAADSTQRSRRGLHVQHGARQQPRSRLRVAGVGAVAAQRGPHCRRRCQASF